MANEQDQMWGITKGQIEVYRLMQAGYECLFACTYGETIPDDFDYPKKEDGWSMRRALKEWATKNDLSDFVILRNTTYQKDLHGIVYEIYGRL